MHEYIVASLTGYSKGLIQEFNVKLSIHVDSELSLQNHILSRTLHSLYVVQYIPWVLIHHPLDEQLPKALWVVGRYIEAFIV